MDNPWFLHHLQRQNRLQYELGSIARAANIGRDHSPFPDSRRDRQWKAGWDYEDTMINSEADSSNACAEAL